MSPRNSAEPVATEGSTWRELAVARSLDPARLRAEKRVQRFLDAELELMQRSPDKEFTVQEVVERSGQSLRSFYQYFAGKHELLLALFEESVRTSAEHLAASVEDVDDPLERVRVCMNEYYAICTPDPKRPKATKAPNPNAIAEFAQQLLTHHPREAASAFAPLVDLLESLLQDAADAGVLRQDVSHRRIAGVLLQEIMFSAFAATI